MFLLKVFLIFRKGKSNSQKKLLILGLLVFLAATSQAQTSLFDHDELTVDLNVPKKGIVEIPVAIRGNDAFLPVQEFFNILQLKNVQINTGIIGFIIHPDSTYHINYQEKEINYRNKTFKLLETDVIKSSGGNYLKSGIFGEVFGLNANFSFRTLSVSFNTEKDLPFIKELKRQELRENLNHVKGVIVPDTVIPRSYPFFRPGVLDWGIVATQQSQVQDDNRLMLGFGTMFLGGETNLMLNYSTQVPFHSRNQFYQWRHINNESRLFKQVTAGRIFTRATSSLFAPVTGVQVSNSPMQTRRSFGTYTLSDYTDPRWTVELYVNNVLVDFIQADASGFYTFEVPLMYGNTNISLRFYGPYGEERVEERLINIPYNFVPKNELEYTLSAGLVENEEWNRFSRFNMNYGLSNSVSVGAGVEYLSEVNSGEVMPFLNSSVRLASNLLFSGEYMYGVKGDALLSYRSPRSLQLDINYVKYHKDQTAINYNYLEERKISLSAPIKTRSFSMFGRLSLNQMIVPTTELTTAQLLLSGAVMGISTNLTTYGIYNDRTETSTIYSALSQTYRLPNSFLFSPQVQYDFSRNRFNNLVLEIERPLFHRGFLNLAYEHNFLRDAHIFEVGLRYNFDFAQTALTSRIGNLNSSFVESARGSLLLDNNTGVLMTSNRSSMSRAALTIIPFLDYNQNGIKDPMEPGVPGLELRNRSGRVSYNKDRTMLWITELQPYVDVLLELDPTSLDNIAWKIPNPKIAVHTLPNHFQKIYVPVQVMGEVAGMVFLKDEKGTRGQGRITIQILDTFGNEVARFLTEGDGYFTFLGLPPGEFIAQIDPEQLNKLEYTATPEGISFEIEVDQYGDIVNTLEFTIESNSPSKLSSNGQMNAEARETKVAEVPVAPVRTILIDLGERGYYAFSDTNINIKLIQKFLKELGYKSGKADGIYGEKTLQAVRNFQKDEDIILDGIFGNETLTALKKQLDSQE